MSATFLPFKGVALFSHCFTAIILFLATLKEPLYYYANYLSCFIPTV